jgi:hypothetical protein
LVPVTPMAGLQTRLGTPEEVLGWRDVVEKYAGV